MIENVELTYVFSKETLLKFSFSPNQHNPTTPMNRANIAFDALPSHGVKPP
jgi:hypothetical protein